MNYRCISIMVMTLTMMISQSSSSPVWNLIHDTIQQNVAGVPVIHEHTEWDFHPDQGKGRRVQFEALNGPRGRDLIARLGMGMNFNGPWGVKVDKVKPDLRYATTKLQSR